MGSLYVCGAWHLGRGATRALLVGLVLCAVVQSLSLHVAAEDVNVPGTIAPPDLAIDAASNASASGGAGDGFSALTHNETTQPSDGQANVIIAPSEAPSLPLPTPAVSPAIPDQPTSPVSTSPPSPAPVTEVPSQTPVPSPTPPVGPGLVPPTIEPTHPPDRPTPQPTKTESPVESPPPPQSAIPQPTAASPMPSSPAPAGSDESPAPPGPTDHETPPPNAYTPTPTTVKPQTKAPPVSVKPTNGSIGGSNATDDAITASPTFPVPSPLPSSSTAVPKEGTTTRAPTSTSIPSPSPPSPSESPTASPVTTKPPSPIDEEANQLKREDPTGQGKASQQGANASSGTVGVGSIVSILGVVFGAAAVLVLALCVVHTRRIRRGDEPDTPAA